MLLTLAETKEHLRIETNDEDTVVTKLILQAQAVAEDFCRVRFEEKYTVIPEPVRLACLLFVSHYYENRDVPDRTLYGTMRLAFENLLYPYRDPELMF